MLHLLAQLQKESQLDIKTNNTQNHQKIELYGNATTKDLKKQHSSRQVGGVQTPCGAERQQQQNGWSHIHMRWIKIRRGTLEVSDPAPG